MLPFFKLSYRNKNSITIRDFIIDMEIGVNDDEKGHTQRVLINISLEPISWPNASHDNINETVSYDDVVKIVLTLSKSGHVHLVETIAEKIAKECLGNLPIKRIDVKVEKLDIYGFAIPGVEITRTIGR